MDLPLYQKFSKALSTLYVPDSPRLFAVALSGGIDSMALYLLMEKWCKQHEAQLWPVHVDHSLRPESAQEAQTLKDWLHKRGHNLIIKEWSRPKKTASKIQEKARQARYGLLQQVCIDHNIPYLLTAHHQDDDQETHHMRKEKQSTDLGLAGISAFKVLDHCCVLRPLLNFKKEELTQILGNHPHIADPSNQKQIFHRNRVRHKKYPFVDLTLLKDQRGEAEEAVALFLATHLNLSPLGYATLPLKQVAQGRSDVANGIACVLRVIGNTTYLPTEKDVSPIFKKDVTALSLCRCCLYKKEDKLWIVPDVRSLPPTVLKKGSHFVWDRFMVYTPTSCTLAPLGAQGWAQIKCGTETDLPYPVLKTLPAFWIGKTVVSVPFLKTKIQEKGYDLYFKPTKSILAEIFV